MQGTWFPFAIRRTLILSLLPVSLSCGGGDFPKYYQLGDLRILAITAPTPEVAPGTTVTLTPYISDLNGAGRTIAYSAEACTDPGVAFGAEPSCAKATDRVSLGTGNLAGLAGPNYTGAVTTFNVTVPASILTGRSAIDAHNGVAYLFVLTLTPSGSKSVTSFKRLIASSKATKNSNPTLSDILANGSSLAALPATNSTLAPSIAAGSSESYTWQSLTGSTPQSEVLSMSWFTSDGTLDKSRTTSTESNGWKPPGTAPAGRNVLLIGVLRDDRGGSAITIKSL